MSEINTLIESASKLSSQLEQSANNEKNLCVDFQLRLEQMSWETYKMANELRELRNYL